MEIIFMLVGLSLLAALFFLGSFIWAIKDGQYEDDYTPAVRMLFDDEIERPDPENKVEKSSSKTKIKTVNN